MAEVFGAASAAVGVATAAGQLIDGIRKLSVLCSELRAIPEDIQNAVEDLETLTDVLENLKSELEPSLPALRLATLGNLLSSLEQSSRHVAEVLEEMKSQVGKRKWGRVTALGTKRKLEKSVKRVEGTQIQMLLALATDNRSLVCQGFDANQRGFAAVSSRLESFQTVCVVSATDTGANQSLHGITANSSDTDVSQSRNSRSTTGRNRRQSTSRSRIIQLSLFSRAWELSLNQANQGWDFSFRTHRILPRSSELFEACWQGDLPQVQELIATRRASIWDTDKNGRTVLHFAAKSWRRSTSAVALFKFLLQNGADLNASDTWGFGVHRGLAIRLEDETPPNIDVLVDLYRTISLHPDWNITGIFASNSSAPRLFHAIPGPGIVPDVQDSFDMFLHPPPEALGLLLDQVCVQWTMKSLTDRLSTLFYRGVFQGTLVPYISPITIRRCLGSEPYGAALVQCSVENQNCLICYMMTLLAFSLTKGEYEWVQEIRRSLMEMLNAGIEFHERTMEDRSAMQVFLASFVQNYKVSPVWSPVWGATSSPQNILQALQTGPMAYLNELQSLGVDIATVAVAELTHLQSWAPRSTGRRLRILRGYCGSRENWCDIFIIGLEHGPRIEDWRLWTSNPFDEMSGEFWDMIDHPERAMPGGWVEEEEDADYGGMD